MQRERTWARRLEEAGRKTTTETTSQTDESEAGSMRITIEELDSRLSAQRQRLQLEADEAKRRAVEEARKLAQRELQERHLEDMATQVSSSPWYFFIDGFKIITQRMCDVFKIQYFTAIPTHKDIKYNFHKNITYVHSAYIPRCKT